MTCIIGYLDPKTKKVTIGADSAGVGGLNITIRKDKKIFKKGNFVIGCTSSFRMIQLLQFKLHLPQVGTKDIYEYMCTDFIDAVRNCFKDNGFIQKDKEVESGGCFLIGYEDRLFCIQDDFQVAETLCGMDAIGCGEEYALGALFQNNDSKCSAESKITDALIAATFFSAGVAEPYYLLTT